MAYIRSLLDRVCSIEKWTLIGFVVAAFLILSFAVLASEVAEGETRAFDERILLMFRIPGDLSRTIGPPWLKEAVRDITALAGTSVLAIIVAGVVGFLAVSGVRHAAIMVLTSVLSGVSLSNGLKVGFSRARPDLVPQDTVIYTASFPSGHATLSAVVYLTLGALLCTQSSRAVKAYILSVAGFLTVLVGISRVYLGVHWPTDVIAGWLLGGTWALLCWFVMLWLQSRGEVEPEQPAGSQKA